MIVVSERWREIYPQAHLGALVMEAVHNPRRHPELQTLKRDTEAELRRRFAGADKASLAALPVMAAYGTYYKRFRKTYHVLLQLRSVALEGKSIPSVAALVETMFLAELRNGLLTAAHDLAATTAPVTLDVAQGDERYVLLNGREQTLKAGDMMMTDANGVICSVIYGSDQRTAIGPGTQRVMFIVYAPQGIGGAAVRAHLEEIETYVRVIAPQAITQELRVYGQL
jgi:DNA/RNA-binding domain of Phe-tRNA-synthetase-like protein